MSEQSRLGGSRAARAGLTMLLAAHGVAHFVAVAGLVLSAERDQPVVLFGGLVVTWSPAVPMVLMLVLAACGAGFIAAAGMLAGREPELGPLLTAVAVLSLITTALSLWGTVGGVLVNLVVLALVPDVPRLVRPDRLRRGDGTVATGPPTLAGDRAPTWRRTDRGGAK